MIRITPPPADYDELASQLKLLANPKRLRIIHMLMEGIQCNCILGDALEMPANLVSHHLGLLRNAGLVKMERDPVDSRWVYYSIDAEAMQQLNESCGAFFDLGRIKPRRAMCGPREAVVPAGTVEVRA